LTVLEVTRKVNKQPQLQQQRKKKKEKKAMTELLNQPIVIDNVRSLYSVKRCESTNNFEKGSGIIKAGFAGEEQPKYIEPSMWVSFELIVLSRLTPPTVSASRSTPK
jgi:hypothetical protein